MYNSEEDNRFKTISEFKECIIRGGEPVFIWNGITYGVCVAMARQNSCGKVSHIALRTIMEILPFPIAVGKILKCKERPQTKFWNTW